MSTIVFTLIAALVLTACAVKIVNTVGDSSEGKTTQKNSPCSEPKKNDIINKTKRSLK